MYNYLLCALLLIAAAACTSDKEEAVADQTVELDSLLAGYHEEYLKYFPIEATLAGDARYNDTLPNDLTAEYREGLRQFFSSTRDRLQSIDRSGLNESQQISYDILMRECEIVLDGLAFKDYLMPINQFWSTTLMVGQMASGSSFQPFKSVQDYDNWLARLDDYVVWVDSAVVNMKLGMAEGYIIPKALAQKVIPQVRAFDHGPVESHLFYGPIRQLPDSFPAGEKERLTGAYQKMIAEKIIPAHKRLSDFIAREYLPGARTTSGISELPGGRELYQYLIRRYTTTDMTADEVFALGKSEVERITREMEKVKDEVGFDGDLQAFFNHIRTNKALMPYSTPEEVIAHYEEIHERMKPQLEKLFDKKPKTPFEVRRTEAFREASASAEYNPGSLDGTRPGVFYVPIPDASAYNIYSSEDLFLHEAIPGHHYQISLQQENTSLPRFRKTLGYSAYTEGWALYCESLGKELGLYTDPYQYFGMLSAEMHRAIRLVVDAGMHTQGWTREDAIQYSLEHEAEPEADVIAEIERYMAIPGQALSYKVGQLKIIELRNRAEEALGESFDVAQFHNQILDSGCLPLDLLEDKVDRWIASQKGGEPASE